jgi:hypothetical protein
MVGGSNASYFNVPLAMRHSQLRGKNDELDIQHVTSTQLTTINNILPVDNTVTLTSTTTGSTIAFFNNDNTTIKLLVEARTPSSGFQVSEMYITN